MSLKNKSNNNYSKKIADKRAKNTTKDKWFLLLINKIEDLMQQQLDQILKWKKFFIK